MKTTLRMLSGTLLGLAAMAGTIEAQEAAKPTAEHREMAKEVGVWDAEVKVWTQGPDGPPETSKGVEEITLMPGGLWILSKFEGEMAGHSFTGRGISGYDPDKKKFIDVWVDSTDPHMMILEGDYDQAAKTLTSFGKSTDPRTGKPYDVKTVTVLKGDDEREFTFLLKNDETQGEYLKILQMTYRRRAK
ncbi:DUF1579 domain-containing protein [Planctomyces sp. SH-PL62]|uniref:DUF1579 domain-containing protein n=1 Tax=Planctomyces sp. SH-PL62 TaxID=1636152 RepID=UPI00078BB0DE|nr:DUF1579 domain-containing protein [Planctomyces sp. SH-PL62]AMV39592.1 hypothetical protein VT85_19310 [Planctomyces sp. SH-PL62]